MRVCADRGAPIEDPYFVALDEAEDDPLITALSIARSRRAMGRRAGSGRSASMRSRSSRAWASDRAAPTA